MRTLTPRQLDVAAALRNFLYLNGRSPSLEELGDQIGVGKVTVLEHLRALRRKGVVRWTDNLARTLEMVPGDPLPDEDRSTLMPLLGTIAAGDPIRAAEDREELDLESLFQSRHGVYTLKVRGDSMIDDHLCDGDYVVIERRANARQGEHAVVLIDGREATLKRYFKLADGRVRLEPANAKHEAREFEPGRTAVQGVVIGMLRNY